MCKRFRENIRSSVRNNDKHNFTSRYLPDIQSTRCPTSCKMLLRTIQNTRDSLSLRPLYQIFSLPMSSTFKNTSHMECHATKNNLGTPQSVARKCLLEHLDKLITTKREQERAVNRSGFYLLFSFTRAGAET